MYYADDIVEQVRSSVDIVDVIGSYVRLKRKGNSYFGLCPFHNEKTGSFSVSGQKQMYYCFGCGAGGNVFTFLMEYENASFTEALKMLADRAGIRLPEENPAVYLQLPYSMPSPVPASAYHTFSASSGSQTENCPPPHRFAAAAPPGQWL